MHSLYSLEQIGQSLVQAVEGEAECQTVGLCSDLTGA